jgi:hypothetical protein
MACLKTLSSYDIVCARSRSHHERTSQPWTMSLHISWRTVVISDKQHVSDSHVQSSKPPSSKSRTTSFATAQRNLERKARHGNPPMHHHRPKKCQILRSQTKVPCIEQGALSERRIVTYHDGIQILDSTLFPLIFTRFRPHVPRWTRFKKS